MTLSHERTRAIQSARNFLRDLMDREKTPRISPEIRKRARSVLKHFPHDYEIAQVANRSSLVVKPDPCGGDVRFDSHLWHQSALQRSSPEVPKGIEGIIEDPAAIDRLSLAGPRKRVLAKMLLQ